MLMLIMTTITASFFDSLNPSAIAQQMLLQAMVKNKRHIWFFILGIGIANLGLGLAVYYGIAKRISNLILMTESSYPLYLYGLALGVGFIFLLIGFMLIKRTILTRKNCNDENLEVKRPNNISPLFLFILGAAFCIVELTSALPYFGFIAVLTNYNLLLPWVILFIFIYSFIYVFPLVLLYFGYNKLQGTVFIKKLEGLLSKISAYVVPVAVLLVGIFLIYYGGYSLL